RRVGHGDQGFAVRRILEVLDPAWLESGLSDQAQGGARGTAGGVVVDGDVGRCHGADPPRLCVCTVSSVVPGNASRRTVKIALGCRSGGLPFVVPVDPRHFPPAGPTKARRST